MSYSVFSYYYGNRHSFLRIIVALTDGRKQGIALVFFRAGFSEQFEYYCFTLDERETSGKIFQLPRFTNSIFNNYAMHNLLF